MGLLQAPSRIRLHREGEGYLPTWYVVDSLHEGGACADPHPAGSSGETQEEALEGARSKVRGGGGMF
jgi:hypothetical protein